MSKVRFLKVEITQNSLLKTIAEVPQWEAQVLLAVWGEDAVVQGEVATTRELPDPRDEFARLANKYGPKDDDNPFVARVYGNFGPGIRALEKEFQAATVSDDYVPAAVVEQQSAETALLEENADLRAQLAALQAVPLIVPPNPALENAQVVIGAGEALLPVLEPGAGEAPVSELGGEAFDASSLLPPGTSVEDLTSKAGEDISDLTG